MRVLFLTHRLPYAPNRGDRLRAFHIARTLATSVDLEIVSLAHDREEHGQIGRLEAMGTRVTAIPVPRLRTYARAVVHLAGDRPLTHLLLDAPGLADTLDRIVRERPPDVVLAYCSGMARFAMHRHGGGSPVHAYQIVTAFAALLVDYGARSFEKSQEFAAFHVRET